MISVLRNVGELASPYFLVDLWARRDEIDIDPETYATLKRKARTLVRDARAFESRGEEPDDDWRSRRRQLLALEPLVEKPVTLEDGSIVPLQLWRDASQHSALLVLDLVGFADPDARPEGLNDPPSTAFELALDGYKEDRPPDWGLLLAGYEVRIYRRSSGISQQYLGLSLDSLVELDDESNWRAFAGIFRAPAFSLDEDGIPLIRRIVDESRRHASKLADDMRADVVDAAEVVIRGVLEHPANSGIVGSASRATLHDLFEQTLYYLYRILFVLYAEAREILPLSAAGPYATTYSIDHLVERARIEADQAPGTYYVDTLKRLFSLLWTGPPERARALGVEPVGGELFDPSRTALFDQCTVDDAAWRRALTSVALGAPGSARRKLGRRSSFAELGVDQLGSIYEGLLVLEPFVAPGPRVLAYDGGERRVVEPDDVNGMRVVRHLGPGDFVLESASGRRKGSGSFYTPTEMTEYLAHAALDPIIEPIVSRANENPSRARAEALAIRVCDPAMGSGAFLVQAARILGLALARVTAASGDGKVTPEMVRRAERDIVRQCVYGVDLNPLAVVLAKVSLWLETLERGRPLSFLDAHLRCGDSLVGINFTSPTGGISVADLATWPKNAVAGLAIYLRKEPGERGERVLQRLRLRRRANADRTTPGQTQLPGIALSAIEAALEQIAVERMTLMATEARAETVQLEFEIAQAFADLEREEKSLRNRLRTAAHFACAQWFSDGEDAPSDEGGPVVPCSRGEYEQVLSAILSGDSIPAHLQAQVVAAHQVAQRRHFFHWALEFPEVIVERGGFDVVIGNPPWNTLSPDVKEFFSTFDPKVFRKGVPKPRQQEREAELRSDAEIDQAWRTEARFLHELSHYAKPESRHFDWYAPDPQLRKGDANVYRLFAERAYSLLRVGGRLAQVLPDSVYVSSPATGVRQHLLTDGTLSCCYVFENRKKLFPIDSRIKVVLLAAQRDGIATDRFRAAFFVGKDAAGRERAVSLEELPAVLSRLENEAPKLHVDQIRALAPETWAFPELQTALDAEIAAHCARALPALNLDDRGWKLTYCSELHADRDAWRFKEAKELEELAASRNGLRWTGPGRGEWWPLVEGSLFYHLEFPMEGRTPTKWVNGEEVSKLPARLNRDGSSVMNHYRVAWRDVAAATNERSTVAVVLPPRTVAKHKAPTVWGGSLDVPRALALAALMSSFCFDYLVRFRGAISLTYGILNSIPAPSFTLIPSVVPLAAEVVARDAEFWALWQEVCGAMPRPQLSMWEIAERRARIDAEIALAYGLSLPQYAALLSTFPNLDTIQPMLPGEPKSFVTRDLALWAYCRNTGEQLGDVHRLLSEIGVSLPEPRPEYRNLEARLEAYRKLGAVPYRPTPRGGRTPTDPELIAAVLGLLNADPKTASDIAEALEEDERTLLKVLRGLVQKGDAFAEGRGAGRRFYRVEEDE